jgi:hexosaminidase
MPRLLRRRSAAIVCAALSAIAGPLLSGCSSNGAPQSAASTAESFADIVPAPVKYTATGQAPFALSSKTEVRFPAGDSGAQQDAAYLSTLFRPATGFALRTAPGTGSTGSSGIRLAITPSDSAIGAQGYRLAIATGLVTISAQNSAGLFDGIQTLRELLPPSIEAGTAQSGVAWTAPTGTVLDYPRYAFRGVMLDVARHFFTVPQVEQYIDQISLYKVDYLDLHLADNQGWRIQIDGWPDLTSVGASTEVGGGPGGFYTQAQYQQLVAYAAARNITVIPEFDVPSHATAALASYPQLGCPNAQGQYTQYTVPTTISPDITSLCASSPELPSFLSAVIDQLAAITPGPYISVSGDEAEGISGDVYDSIVGRAADDVRADGKTVMGYQESSAAISAPNASVYWNPSGSYSAMAQGAAQGTQVILAPAQHTYMDQKYTATTALGLNWAGPTEVEQAYDWNPATLLSGVPAAAVTGIEATLFTETLSTLADLDYMTFPRLPAEAEIGWSPQSAHTWSAFAARLAAQGPRWKAMGVDYYRSPEIIWPSS